MTVSVQGLNGPTACTDLAVGAHADTTGLNTVSECVWRLTEGGVRESATNVEFDVDTGKRLFDWTWLRVRKSGKALRPYQCGPQAAAHRSERYHNYIPQADCPDWEVNNRITLPVWDVTHVTVATMEGASPWRHEDDSTGVQGFETPLHRPANPGDTSFDVERVRKAPSVSTSRGIYATSPGQVVLLAMGHDNKEQGVLTQVRRALFSPTTEAQRTTSTQVAGSLELSDQAHTPSTPLLQIERGRPVGLTEIDNADSPCLTTRQHSVAKEGPVDKGLHKTKPHVGISDPSSDVSGQTQEQEETAAKGKKKGKKKRRHRKHKGTTPEAARAAALEAELVYRHIHSREHKRQDLVFRAVQFRLWYSVAWQLGVQAAVAYWWAKVQYTKAQQYYKYAEVFCCVECDSPRSTYVECVMLNRLAVAHRTPWEQDPDEDRHHCAKV